MRTAFWIVGAVVGIAVAARLVYLIRGRRLVRESRRRQIEEWTALARSRGFETELREGGVVIRGTVASRPFVIDGGNFFTYGMDSENVLHFRSEDEKADFVIHDWQPTWLDGSPHHLRQPPVGDAAFDARYHVRANAEGLRYVARLGPDERRILLRTSEFCLFQSGGEARIRLPYRLDAAHLDDALELVTRLWGPLSSVSRPENADAART